MSSWLLQSTAIPSESRVGISTRADVGGSVGDYFEITAQAGENNPNGEYFLAGMNRSDDGYLVLTPSGLDFRVQFGPIRNLSNNYTQPTTGQVFTVRIERTETGWDAFLDSVPIGSIPDSGRFRLARLMNVGSLGWLIGSLHGAKASTNGGASVTNEWDPSASNGTGSTLIDTVGGNNGTLVNFPTDDSQWVPYGEPPDDIDATIALTMPQFSAAVSAATTAPGVSASVAFTMPQFTALVDAEQQAPQYAASIALTMPQFSASIAADSSAPTAGATVAFSMPQLIAAATADSTAPQYPASVAFAMPQFTAAVQAQAIAPGSGASVSFVMPNFTAEATAESTVPEFPAVAAFTMPQFGVVVSAEASLPATGAVVSYTMPQFTVAASGASTVPTLAADVAYTMPQFGVMVLTDETPLGTAPGARLAWVAGSNKLAYNVGSNRLSWRA